MKELKEYVKQLLMDAKKYETNETISYIECILNKIEEIEERGR